MKARALFICLVLFCGLVSISCNTGPAPPAVGSPEFYWAAAKETYAAGDYVKASEHLSSLTGKETPFTSRAQAWQLILTAGMAHGYMEMADYFEFGAKANRGNPTPFRRNMRDFRTYASRLALQFAETWERFEKLNQDQEITLDFPFPRGSALPNPLLSKIGNGELLQAAVLDDTRRQQLETGVVLMTCRAVGAPDDTAKTQELFKTSPVKVPREVFLLEMANQLHEFSNLYGPAKMNEPQRQEFMLTHAGDVLKTVPETKQSKALLAKVEKGLKTLKK
jgi:hypothetical protein